MSSSRSKRRRFAATVSGYVFAGYMSNTFSRVVTTWSGCSSLEEYSNIDMKMQDDCVFNSVVSTVIHKLLTNCCV